MNDEQIARAFVQQMRHPCDFGTAVLTLAAIIGEARSTERARCAAIVERFTEPGMRGYATHTPAQRSPERARRSAG